jgi:hypothetical protein
MPADSIFDGRVLAIMCKEPRMGAVLENVRVEQLGGRTFLVGTLADRGDSAPDPRTGMTFWFAVDDVRMLTEYADLQTARKTFAARKKANRRFWRWGRRSWE